jgi:hypothetical protein
MLESVQSNKLSHEFSILRRHNGIVFILVLEYAVKKAKESRNESNLSGTYRLLVYADSDNLLVEDISTTIKYLDVK